MDYTLEGEEFFKKTGLLLKFLFIPSKDNNFRPKFLQSKILLYFVICLFILKLFISAISLNFPQNIFFADVTRISLINFVNQSRGEQGLQPLIENEKLDKAAVLKAQDMLENNYFAHKSPQGITPWYWFLQSDYNYKYAGENLAIGFLNSEEVFNAWYNSSSHRENILNPNYKEFGMAVLEGNFNGNITTIIVQLFGSPLAKQAQVIQPAQVAQLTKPEPQNSQAVPIVAQKQEQNQTAQESEAIYENSSVIDNETPEVLSQTSEYPILKPVGKNTANALYLQFLNFVYYQYDEILKIVVYGFLLLIAIAMLLNIVICFNIQHSGLIFRSFLILSLLILTITIDGNIIASIIL